MSVERDGLRRRRRLSAAARRATILEAATRIFTAAGYERTRMADVAAAVGVTEPVVFQHFGTKADLFVAVLDRVSEQVMEMAAMMVEDAEDVLELLRRVLAPEHIDQMHTSSFGRLFIDVKAASGEEKIEEAGRRGLRRVVEGMSLLIRRGQEEGSIRADVDPTTITWLVFSLLRAREFRRVNTSVLAPNLEHELLDAIVETLRPR